MMAVVYSVGKKLIILKDGPARWHRNTLYSDLAYPGQISRASELTDMDEKKHHYEPNVAGLISRTIDVELSIA